MKVKDIIFMLNQLEPDIEVEFVDSLEGSSVTPEWDEVILTDDGDNKCYIFNTVGFFDAVNEVQQIKLKLPQEE